VAERSFLEWSLVRRVLQRAAARPRGFSEPFDAAELAPPPPPEQAEAVRQRTLARIEQRLRDDEAAPGADRPFPSTGPHGHRHRMRQRLLERGGQSLADYEVLEMLLFFAMPKGDTKPLAKTLINRFGSFAAVLTTPTRTLLDTPGLGEHSVAAIRLVQDAALRLARAEAVERPAIENWERLTDYLRAAMARDPVEQFRVLFLDTRNRLLADEVMGRGTVNHTPVYPREVIRRALELHATALILVHNHPSGDPRPSDDDVAMTDDMRIVAQVMGIVIHDHVIVARERLFSFKREGYL
jgi:DNA repair protein RadC